MRLVLKPIQSLNVLSKFKTFRHPSSFILSVLIHILLLVVIFYSYEVLSSPSKEEVHEKSICVSLSCLPHKIDEPHRPTPPQPKEIKPEKKKPKKKIEKPKKIIAPVVEDLIVVEEEPVEPQEPEEEVVQEESEHEHETKELEEVVPTHEDMTQETQTKPSTQSKEQAKDSHQTEAKTSPQDAYINEHLQEIVRLLQENLYYPRSARKRGIEGEVIVKFRLLKSGKVDSIEILSSEHSILSSGARETIESLSEKFPKPDETLELRVPIGYSLR